MFEMYPDPVSRGEMRYRQEVELCAMADLVLVVGPKLADAYLASIQERRTCL